MSGCLRKNAWPSPQKIGNQSSFSKDLRAQPSRMLLKLKTGNTFMLLVLIFNTHNS